MSSAGVSTEMYNNLLQQNPLQQMGQVANISNALAENKLLQTQAAQQQQTLRANQAMGPIMQQSVGADGQVDYGKAATLMASNPDTAFLAPDFLTKAYQGQGLQLDNTLKKMDLFQKKQQIYGDAAGSLLPLGPGVKSTDVAKKLGETYSRMAQEGLADGETADQFITLMGKLPDDGAPLHQFLQQSAQQHAGAASSLASTLGQFMTINQGGQQVLGYTNPATQQFVPVGVLAQTPTTSERNQPIQTVDTSGATHVSTAQNTLPLVTGTGAPVNGGWQAQPQLGGQPPTGAPLGGPVTKLGPFQEGQIANMAEYSGNLNKEVSGIQTQLQMIQQLQDLTKEFKPGAGADMRNKMGTVLQAVGVPQSAVDQVDNGSMAATQAFQKYGVQNTMNVLRQSIGGQGRLTNLEFEQFLHANPNIDTDPRAIDKILAFSQKIYQQKVAEQKGLHDWTTAGQAPQDFPQAWTQKLMQRGILRAAAPGDLSQQGASR